MSRNYPRERPKNKQALAAEFPTAAGVRPVFSNLANVYELLRLGDGQAGGVGGAGGDGGSSRVGGGEGERMSDSERAMLPFEGRLLMFWRGNGVEETTGRLLLKKLDYLQVGYGGVAATRAASTVVAVARW